MYDFVARRSQLQSMRPDLHVGHAVVNAHDFSLPASKLQLVVE